MRIRLDGCLSWLALVVATVVAMCVSSCVAPNPACSQQAENDIERNYIAEVIDRCHNYGKTWRTACPAMADINKRYDAERKAWVACR